MYFISGLPDRKELNEIQNETTLSGRMKKAQAYVEK